MTGMPEHAHRAAEHRQPRDRRVDHTSPGFVRPPDPATGVNAGPPSDRDGAGDAPDEAKGPSTPAPVAVNAEPDCRCETPTRPTGREPEPLPPWECLTCGGYACEYADPGRTRCSPSICDCFIAMYPDSPRDLHPEAFIVGPPLTPADPHPHAWDDLGKPGLHGSVCRLCGETQID